MTAKRVLIEMLAICAVAATGCAKEANKTAPPVTAESSGHIVIGPYVQPGRDPDLTRTLRMVWWSDVPGAATLEVQAGEGVGQTVKADTVALQGIYRHSAEIARPGDLSSETVTATVTADGKRYTAPSQRISFPRSNSKKPFRFAALGDTGAGNESERRVAEGVVREKAELLVIPGDVAYNSGEFAEYKKNFFPYYKDLMARVPILPALGNHDVGNPEHMGAPYRAVWMPPSTWMPPKGSKAPYTILKRRANSSEGNVPAGQWFGRNYSADAGDCHFVCLDSTVDHDTIRDLIVPWLKADLAGAKRAGAKWFIAFWHHPPYTHGGYRDNSQQWGDIRELIVPVLKEAGVQLVLNGHDHNYQHMKKDGINYIVTGGGGGRLYPVVKDYDGNGQPPILGSADQVRSFTMFEESTDSMSMAVRQIDENGHQLDAFSLSL